ncbi:hypothetical protein [Kineococcus terrestris]|uniref:hypothetical protein n=1 Tax=Kineococcus terrestris TaxID=2044856 RepID=UPI0034DB02B4
MSPRRAAPRRAAARTAAAVLAVPALLAGCAQLPPVPAVPADPAPAAPVVAPVQAERVVGDVVRAVREAGDDPEALAGRVTGPELALRRAAARVRGAGAEPPPTGSADELTPLSSSLPRQEDWPRWFLVVTEPGADSAPSVVVLRSESPREPYRVWATPSLLPGTSLPTTEAPALGVAVVGPDEDANLLASPREVAQRYADVLTDGDAAPAAADFAEDAYREQVTRSVAEQTEALRAGGGTFSQSRELLDGADDRPLVALRTRDGGALVVAGYRWETTATGPEGGLLGDLDPVTAALAGREQARSARLVREEVVVLDVPPTDGGVVSVLAVQSGLTEVEAG